MRAFSYTSPKSWQGAAKALRDSPMALPKAAGTDLLDLMKERVLEPTELVNVLRVPHAKGGPDTLPATMTLAGIAASPHLREHYPALFTAAADAATPQVRNVGTLGGNICQLSRCAYLRSGHPCLKLGDETCSAGQPDAHTRFHAIFPSGGCLSAHASNLAPALIAVGAVAVVVGPKGQREVPLDAFYAKPESGQVADTVLAQDELVASVQLKPSALTRNSVYLEVRERQSFDFALVSVAAAVHLEDGKVKAARIALGAVAPTPRRAKAAEKALIGKALNADTIRAAASAARAGAKPTTRNTHKVILVERLLTRALQRLAGEKKQ